MKTFEDIEFKNFLDSKPEEGLQGVINFSNGYGVSVLCGARFFSNGKDTYELCVLYNGEPVYPFGHINGIGVFMYITKQQVSNIMRGVQSFKS